MIPRTAPNPAHRYGEHHRDIQGGTARAAVFGISDGLVTNVSLILGMAGAAVEPEIVRVAGLAGLLAGAFSMAAGEYISMTAQSELMQRELSRERREQRENPELEEEELASIYQSRGLDPESARNVAEQVMQDPDVAVEVHAREEMGIDPDQLGAPGLAAVSSFGAFAVGAIIPLVPWFFLQDTAAVVTSIVLAAITALSIGAVIGLMTERSPMFSAVRQLTIGAIAGAVTYGVGIILGVQVT